MEFNMKKILFNTFVCTVEKYCDIDLSGLQNPTELFNFLKNFHQIYLLYDRYKKGYSNQSKIEQLNCELKSFCQTFKNVLPEKFIKQAEEVDKNPNSFLQSFYLQIFSLWGGLGSGYIVVQAMMYISQWRDVINTKREIEELIGVGHSYKEIGQVLMKIEILHEKTNELDKLVKEFLQSKQSINNNVDNKNHLLGEIRNLLKDTNKYFYEPIMKSVEKLKQNLEKENVSLSERRENVGYWEKASYFGVGLGIALSLFSAYDSKQNNGKSRVNSKYGWTLTAASVGSLGLSATEKWRVDGRLDLVKDRFNQLAEIDRQLAEIKAILEEFEKAIN